MGIFTYQCKCGMRFEVSRSSRESKLPHVCPECGEMAPRVIPEDINGSFKQNISGPVPQNTGVSELDTHIDQVIGESARKGWEVADKRVAEKRAVLERHPDAGGRDLSRNPDGTYRVLGKEERGVHDRALGIHEKAMTTLQKEKIGKTKSVP